MGLPTTPEVIMAEELRLDNKLPEIIKSIVLKNNGGAECIAEIAEGEIWFLYAVKDTRSRKHISRSANHIEKETISAREWHGFPIEAIALGENGCGDYLITLKGSLSIYIWRHETGDMRETSIRLFS